MVYDKIESDEDMAALFPTSVKARAIFNRFNKTVTDTNYLNMANDFLDEADEYIKALERVQKDLHFINTQFDEIEDEKEFIAEVKDELEKTGSDMTAFNQKRDLWRQARESDLVRNAQMMRQTTQEIKDLYYHLMQHSAEQLSEACVELLNRADALRQKCSAYPEEWNVSIYNKVKGIEQSYQKLTAIDARLGDGWSIRCRNINMQLRDMEYKLQQVKIDAQNLDIWEMEINTTDPNPAPKPQQNPVLQPNPAPGIPPQPAPQPVPQPKVYKMRSKMPHGKCSVAEYRSWLQQQLMLVSKMGKDDEVDFEE